MATGSMESRRVYDCGGLAVARVRVAVRIAKGFTLGTLFAISKMYNC